MGVWQIKKIFVFLMFLSFLSGCVSNKSESDLSGAVLGWQNHLYKLVSVISPDYIGEKLDVVSYHGNVSETLAVYQLKGFEPKKAIVFETSRQRYYKAIATNEVIIGAHGNHAPPPQNIFLWLFVPIFILVGIIVVVIMILKRI